jgi:uncharacterized protein YecE (DUF72 family)
MAFHVGIGSWGDDAYVGVLYPPGLPKDQRLHEYTRSFGHVEVNSTYYATPSPKVTAGWVKQTPKGFTFTFKLHRAFSQSPAKAAENQELVARLEAAVAPLIEAKRLTAYLLVLPPRFGPERHSLDELAPLAKVLSGAPLAVELRDRAWVTGKRRAETLAFFRKHKLVWIAVDMPQIAGSSIMPAVDEVTNPKQAYVRLHGRNPKYLEAESAAEGHHYAYTARELTSLATRVRKLAAKAKDVFVIANNHAEDFAPRTALALQQRLRASAD